jgi:MIP family channel proteins
MQRETSRRELLGKLVAEVLGTGLLVFMVCSSVVVPRAYLSAPDSGSALLVTAFIQGLSLMAVVFTFADVSGSHFNPAITLMFVILGSFSIVMALAYVVCQIAGSILGAYVFRACMGRWASGAAGATVPGDAVRLWQAFIIELIITTLLLFVVVSTSFNLQNGLPSVRPLPIGFSVVAGVLVAGSLTGASMNPVRSLGPAIVASTWRAHYIYWIAPLASSVLVGTLYRFLFRAAVSPIERPLV